MPVRLDRIRSDRPADYLPGEAFQKELIVTLFVTILIEGAVVLGYCSWRKKPARSIFFSSVFINLLTQSLLWVALNFFFHNYLLVLFLTEGFIWLIEAFLLFVFKPNRFGFQEAMLLSLFMNLASFISGWFLPV